ncbi:DNA repair protein RecN [Neisseria sp. Ec49-e6-T10]|uniref:DNA repair protein RecN n=1 Tax=Neisseria sp. Ec49-e6-T10 TaxID=3140744 RepID=UPI003EB6AE64
MLLSLSLKNFVIVEQLNLDFQSGFTVLTGETGAGKSITLDALGLLMGDKASADQVRSGTKEAQLSALFDLTQLPDVQKQLQGQGLLSEGETELSVRRTLDHSGKSRSFINNQTATLAQLKALGEELIDIHGQNAHQSLNREATQRQLLDAFAQASIQAKTVKTLFQNWQEAKTAYETAQHFAEQMQIEKERLNWQINELSELNPIEHEWDTLNQQHKNMAHSVELIETATWIQNVLDEGEQNLLKTIHQIQHKLSGLADIHPSFSQSLQTIESVEAELNDITYTMRDVANSIESDPAQFNLIEDRMQQITSLAKKYRTEPEDLYKKLNELKTQAQQLEESTDLEQLHLTVDKNYQAYLAEATTLSNMRQKAAAQLAKKTTEQMQYMAMSGAQFAVILTPYQEPHASGLEQVSYQVALNQGSSLKPLNKVASGGELSRISLSLQVVMSQFTRVPTLIFDEVDAGIGGRVAQMVGKLLHDLGKHYQVLAITHLPQVASCGEHHWQVSKYSKEGQTFSQIKVLNNNERVDEIARMLGGEVITETTKEHAKEMLHSIK